MAKSEHSTKKVRRGEYFKSTLLRSKRGKTCRRQGASSRKCNLQKPARHRKRLGCLGGDGRRDRQVGRVCHPSAIGMGVRSTGIHQDGTHKERSLWGGNNCRVFSGLRDVDLILVRGLSPRNPSPQRRRTPRLASVYHCRIFRKNRPRLTAQHIAET